MWGKWMGVVILVTRGLHRNQNKQCFHGPVGTHQENLFFLSALRFAPGKDKIEKKIQKGPKNSIFQPKKGHFLKKNSLSLAPGLAQLNSSRTPGGLAKTAAGWKIGLAGQTPPQDHRLPAPPGGHFQLCKTQSVTFFSENQSVTTPRGGARTGQVFFGQSLFLRPLLALFSVKPQNFLTNPPGGPKPKPNQSL